MQHGCPSHGARHPEAPVKHGQKTTGPDPQIEPYLPQAKPRDYERVTVYCPQAVNWMLTVAVRAPRTTTATNVPASNRGAVVQLAL